MADFEKCFLLSQYRFHLLIVIKCVNQRLVLVFTVATPADYIVFNELPFDADDDSPIPNTSECLDLYKTNLLSQVELIYRPELEQKCRSALVGLTQYLPTGDINDVSLEIVADADHGSVSVDPVDPLTVPLSTLFSSQLHNLNHSHSSLYLFNLFFSFHSCLVRSNLR